MANGLCTNLLNHAAQVINYNPATKLSPLGFTQAVLSQQDNNVEANVNQQFQNGHTRTNTVKYRKRVLESAVKDTASCDDVNTPAYQEFNIGAPAFRQVSMWLPDSLVRTYCQEASQMVPLGRETSVMRELYSMIVEYGNALLRVVNKDLVTAAATRFGKNLVTDSTSASALSFSLSKNGMDDAFVRLMTDLRENEFCNDVTLVGNGPFANLDLIKRWWASMGADNGMNKAAMMADMPNVFFDKDTRSIWGDNQIGVFERGSMALLAYDQYVGSFAGRRANSDFFTMALPVAEYSCPQQFLDRLRFDVQIREIDCPTTLTVNGSSQTVKTGVQVILSKTFGLFVRPDDLFDDSDPLDGTNGTLRYEITEQSA